MNPFYDGRVALVLFVGSLAAAFHFWGEPTDLKIPPSGMSASTAKQVMRTGGGAVASWNEPAIRAQLVPPAMSVVEKTVAVPKGKGCAELFNITVDQCVKQAEKAGRPVIWHRDTTGKVTIDVPLLVGEIVYLLRDPVTGELLPHFQKNDDLPVEIHVEPTKKPSR